MRRYNIFYFIGEAFKSLYRNGVMTFASVAVLLSCLLVSGGVSMLVMNIDVNLEKLGALNEIVVFCQPDAADEDIDAIESAIREIKGVPNTKCGVVRRTKAEHLDDLKESNPGVYGDITDEENPLSTTITNKPENNKDISNIEHELKNHDLYQAENGYRKVRNNQDLANTVENVKSAIMLVFIWFLAILFIVSIFIIINTIKIAVLNRRKEISIMRYIGASAWFITLPFIFEGIIMGLVAGLGAFFLLQLGYTGIVSGLAEDIRMISLIKFSDMSLYVLLGALGIGVFTGVTGSSISLGKYLND